MDSKKVVLRDDYEPLAEYWHDNILYKKVPGADVVFKVYGKLKFRKSIDGWESIGVHGTALSIDERYSEMRFSDKDANGRVFRNKLHSVFAGKNVMLMDSEKHKNLLDEYENRFASARKRFLDYCAKYEDAKEKKSSAYKYRAEVQKKYNLASREKSKAEGILRAATGKYNDAVKKLQQSKDKFNKVLRDSKEKNRGNVFDRVSGALMQAEKKLKIAQSDLDSARENMEQKEKHFLDIKAELDEAKRVEKESSEYFVNMLPPWSYTEKHE
jgi:hypothetical protein